LEHSARNEYRLTSNAITVTVTIRPSTTAWRHRASGRLCRLSFFDCCSILQNEDATLLNSNPAVVAQPIPAYQNHSADIFTEIVHYIMDHLCDDLSVSTLVKRFSLRESVLLSAFESQTGIALDQFVLRRRIERAPHLLKHSSATDREIAVSVAWRSAPAFQRAFASYLGVSPADYRRSLLAKQQVRTLASRKRPCNSACLTREESNGRAHRALTV
jgi:AraC-like DNA-binding protein